MNRFIAFTGTKYVLLAFCLALSITGCSDSEQTTAVTAEQDSSAVANSAEQKFAGVPGHPKARQGVVKSSAIGGGYSYIEVDILGETFWLATAMTAVKPGDSISWRDYSLMSNFKSRSLNREFSQILFVDRVFNTAQAAPAPSSGIVAEALHAGGYSFIRVETSGSSLWLAAPEISLEVGQAIEWGGGSLMRNFTSRTLQRTFDSIVFVGAVHTS